MRRLAPPARIRLVMSEKSGALMAGQHGRYVGSHPCTYSTRNRAVVQSTLRNVAYYITPTTLRDQPWSDLNQGWDRRNSVMTALGNLSIKSKVFLAFGVVLVITAVLG